MPVFHGALRPRLARGEAALGFAVAGSAGAALAVLAKDAGYDWLILDREHGPAGLEATGQLCIAAGLCGLTPIVRATLGALDEAARALDGGAQGVLVARVESAADARRIVLACRYPPAGRRSWGAAFAQTGASPVSEGIRQAEASTVLIAMVETPDGIGNIGAIAAEPGIDAVFIGALDLSVELGVAGEVRGAPVMRAIEQVADACRRAGKAFGVGGMADEASVRWLVGLGARLLVGGSDQGFMAEAARARARTLRALTASGQPQPAPR